MENKHHHKNGKGSNLTEEDRAKGGRHSAADQERDEMGQFAGKKEKEMEEA